MAEYIARYQEDFDSDIQLEVAEYARRLQRTRLSEFVHLRDILTLFLPLVGWFFCRAYLKRGTLLSLKTMVFHGVTVLDSYALAQMTKKLLAYLNLDRPILKDTSEGERKRWMC